MAVDKINYVFVRNKIVPYEEANLHISDLAIQRGYGVFDFLRIQDGHPFFMDNYLDRFYRSSEKMGLTIPISREVLGSTIKELIQKNDLPISGLKMVLTGGYSADGYTPSEPNLLLIQQPIVLPEEGQVQRGIKIITHEYLREIPSAKTINYTMGIRLLNKIKIAQAGDVLYHYQGNVTEMPRANFFIVLPGNIVKTAGEDILAGITRNNILKIAGKLYPVQIGTISLREVYEAKEAFITSTTKRVMPVVQIDDSLVGNGKPGPVTLNLLANLLTLEKANLPR